MSSKPPGGAAVAADEIIANNLTAKIGELGEELTSDKATAATQAARILSELATKKPELIVALTDRFVEAVLSENKRVVQTAAEALPALAKKAPARVAKHVEQLHSGYDTTTEIGQDGIVKTLTNLCLASVAYQRRLEPMLIHALKSADSKKLIQWTEIVLPALKGEPHANVRAVIEQRLSNIDRKDAQKIADFLGIKLRARINTPQG